MSSLKKCAVVLGFVLLALIPAASAEAYTFTRNLGVGSSGPDVAELQTWLMANGYSIPSISAGVPKGYFGPQTRAAVAAYQRAIGISPTVGFFGPLTRNRVNGTVIAPPPQLPEPTLPLPTCTISANPTVVRPGESTTLVWSSTGATSATLNNGIGAAVVNGSGFIVPPSSTTYVVTVTGRGGTSTCSASVVVTANPPSDTVAPSVTLTSPEGSATVSGQVTVAANALDNTGIAGVQFKLDGVALGAEDVNAPYAVSWDTAASANGSHSLSAVARDAAGNIATAPSRTVTVAHTTNPSSPSCLISYSPASVARNANLSVNWSSQNATARSYTLTDGAGRLIFGPSNTTVSGSLQIPAFTDLAAGTYVRTDTVTGTGGSATCTATLQVTAPASEPVTYRSCGTIPPASIARGNAGAGGRDYVLAPFLADVGDTNESPTRSSVMIFENGTALGPAHSQHSAIRDLGGGRFSHSGGLTFSASDNSDPRANGRTYTYGVPSTGSCPTSSIITKAPSVPPKQIEVAKIASNAPPFALFESHNQLLVSNGHGIFLTFLDTNTDGGAQACYHWSLLRSTDGGKSFTNLYGENACGRAPTVETDEDDNIYLFSPRRENNANVLMWMKFLASKNYADPKIVRLPHDTGGGKSSAIYDRTRQQFYFEGYGTTTFMVIDREGNLVRETLVRVPGPLATTQYPHMRMEGSRLYVAWNSTPYQGGPRRGSFITYSDDGGVTWFTPGRSQALTLPIVSDETGPAAQIQLPPYEADPYSWLASFMPLRGKLHFMFQGLQGKHQIYERFNIDPFASDIFWDNAFNATQFSVFSWDGIFTRNETSDSPLYVVAADSTKLQVWPYKPLVVLKSDNNGTTWTDYAYTSEKYPISEINGARSFRSSEGIIGTFSAGTTDSQTGFDVYFFRIPPGGPEPTPASGNFFRGVWRTGTFENGVDGFQPYFGAAVGRDPSTAAEGSASLKVRTTATRNAAGNAGGAIAVDLPALKIGETYTLSFWAKTETGTLPLVWNVQNGVGDVNCLGGSGQLTTAWQSFKKTCVLDKNKTQLYLYANTLDAAFWIDDIHIEQGQ